MRVNLEARILWRDLLCEVGTISREKKALWFCKNGAFLSQPRICFWAGCRFGGHILERVRKEGDAL